jgi:hypothetical protein
LYKGLFDVIWGKEKYLDVIKFSTIFKGAESSIDVGYGILNTLKNLYYLKNS